MWYFFETSDMLTAVVYDNNNNIMPNILLLYRRLNILFNFKPFLYVMNYTIRRITIIINVVLILDLFNVQLKNCCRYSWYIISILYYREVELRGVRCLFCSNCILLFSWCFIWYYFSWKMASLTATAYPITNCLGKIRNGIRST